MTSPAEALPYDAERSRRIAFAVLLAGALAIAFSPIFVRLSEAGPTATAFWRVALAVPPLWLWLTLAPRDQTRRPERPGDRRLLVLAGLFFAGDLITWHLSIRLTSVANSTLFANFAPIFATLIGWLALGQRVSRRFLGGLALAIIGAVVLVGPHLAASGGPALAGDGLAMVTGLFYGSYIIAVGRLRAVYDAATIMTWSGVITAAAVLPVALLLGEPMLPVSLEGWLVLVGLAWFSHAGGQSLIAVALAHLPAAFASISLLCQPVVSALLAWALLAEPLGPLQALGGLIVLAGIALARRGS